MSLPLAAEALVQMARKRRTLDRAQCARLAVLLHHHGVDTPDKVRGFLNRKGMLPPLVAKKLIEHLPQPDQVSFGDYTALAHLADGGMGSVWLAGTPDGHLAVVKTMRGQMASNAEIRYRFEREVKYMMDLQHDSVVRAIGSGAASDGTLFMVLDFVEHGDLKDMVESHGALPESLALAIVYQVADALVIAQQRQLIHRDIKPANIFASPDGKAKLADFGIARSTSTERTQLTMEGALVGSPYYMSPEQVIADPDLDIRSDIYALGAVLYYCLAGTDPYKGRLQEVLHAHCTAPIPDIRTVNRNVSGATHQIIVKCMAKKREDRYLDPQAMRTALLAALGGAGSESGLHSAVRPSSSSIEATITADLSDGTAQEPGSGSGSRVGPGSGSRPGSHSGSSTHQGSRYGNAESGSRATVVPNKGEVADAGDLNLTIQVGAAEWSDGAAATTPMPEPYNPGLAGQFTTAIDNPWLLLTGDGLHLALFAKRILVCGKLREPPVDVCLRKYPTTQYRDDCLKVSRQHFRLQFDPGSSRLLVGDLGASNGTIIDGLAMTPSSAQVLTPGEHSMTVAGAIQLKLHVVARRTGRLREMPGAPDSTGSSPCGIDHDHAIDCCVLSRPDNRPGMAYALVLRRILIGGPGADLVLPSSRGDHLELAMYQGRWLYRTGEAEWQPVTPGLRLIAGGRPLKASVGNHEVYAIE